MRDLVRVMRSHGANSIAEPESVAELAMWAATADGVLDEREIDDIAGMLAQLPGLEGFDAARGRTLVGHLADTYTSEDAIAARILELTVHVRANDARRACYQLAVWSCARDGQFSEEEAAFLESLQEALELSDNDADALLRATVITG